MPKRVDDVVDVKSVTRPLPITIARQRAIKAVAKPVEKNAKVDQVKQQRILAAGRSRKLLPETSPPDPAAKDDLN